MRTTLLSAALVLALTQAASAATWITSVTGTDSPSCGTKTAPCRSISRAIANASAGDTVLVGPGFYGDLNNNGDFSDPGDEAAEGGGGCSCMIKLDKPLTLKSRDGANVTVIDGHGATNHALRLMDGASGSIVGGTQNGFTLRNAMYGLRTDDTLSGVQVIGNVGTQNIASGFLIEGADVLVKSNRGIANGQEGFDLFLLGGLNTKITGNVAQRNGLMGFYVIESEIVLEKNLAVGNSGDGFGVAAAQADFQSVVSVGNGGAGLLVDSDGSARINGSTLMGNGRTASANCGVVNKSTGALNANGNYWGAATGPGADPADTGCMAGAGVAPDTSGFKTKEIKLKLSAVR
jgi:hypothetical protein